MDRCVYLLSLLIAFSGILLADEYSRAFILKPNDSETSKPKSVKRLPSKPPPKELQGESYFPKPKKLTVGIADWLKPKLVANEGITQVRLYGFDRYNGGKPLDIVLKDSVICKTCEEGLFNILRLATADFVDGVVVTGNGAHIGVIEITTKSRKLIIGVSHVGFFMGVWHGNPRQSFCSWILAKQVDDIIFKSTGSHLTKRQFDRLSGLAWIRRNREIYHSLRD